MDAKDLRTEPVLGERNNDTSKYSQSGGIALHCDKTKSYQDIGPNSLPKVDVQSARPCAVIGPDRIVPPSVANKSPSEPWPCLDNVYHHTRRPPEYPHKLANFQNPSRNISPRQTFQENMQRIMVPPSYNSVKISDDTNYTQMSERNVLPKNIKINVPSEPKFCDVPYTVFPPSNEQKNVRNPDMCLSSVNPNLTRTAPHGWPPGSVNVRPTRAYGAPELYQYQDYSNCAGPRPVMPRPNRTGPEDQGFVYADPFYHQEGNIRFKPYPSVKERYPQQRYDYVSNYGNSFHPPPAFPPHKYELQKTVPPHPYPPYPQIKYLDRVSEPVIEGYQRNQQGSYNIAYRNQIIHPNFGPVLGSCPQNKIHSYPPDSHIKTIGPNKVPYENAKAYIDYENGRPKIYPPPESYLVNEMGRMHPMKNQVIMPNYQQMNMHNIPPNQYYKKDNQQIKNYDYIQSHYRNMDPNMNLHNPLGRHPPGFSPNTLAISPTDSSTSNDTSQILGNPQEDCGYVSQSSTASVRSIDSGINRIPNDYIRKYYDSRFGPIMRNSSMMMKSDLHSTHGSKEKKNIDVRQFLQMWNEGDEETDESIPKELVIQSGPKGDSTFGKTHEAISQANQEQLYVLGLVNVPSEELGKYEHIQKVSKLPENIKGYNHIELLNQFEEAIESSNIANYKKNKDFQLPPKGGPLKQASCVLPPRPLSPLDVEAKISQSVIHKDVGCNFEIKPCSPKMLNADVATPVQNILSERVIEKVANPVMLKSPRLNGMDENIDCNVMKRQDHRLNINNEPIRIPSCKMVNTQFSNNNGIDTMKNSYSLQDLESNSGLCLASLPRLDNDIELNFPEVNQQFINANKRDSTVLAPSLSDLPNLEVLEQSNSPSNEKLNDLHSLTRETDNITSPCVVDSEKEFSKLSKYRKTKTHLADSKENPPAVRTDSVIIKNPENVKNYEEHPIFSPNPLIRQANEIQKAPINLTSQGNITDNPESVSLTTENNSNNKTDSPIGVAIDFSRKNISNDNIESMKSDNDTEILLQNKSKVINPVFDEHLNEMSFSASQENVQPNSIINQDKVDENVLTPKKCGSTQTKKESNSIDNTPFEENFTNNEYLSSLPNVSETKAEYMSPETCGNQLNNDNNNPLSPLDFATPPEDFLQTTDVNSDDYLIDIGKNIEIQETHLKKIGNRNHTPTKDQVKVLKTHKEHVLDNIDSKQKSVEVHMKEVIESESNIDTSKDNDVNLILKETEFTNANSSDSVVSSNMELTNEEEEEGGLDSKTIQLKSTEQNIDPNLSLSSGENNSSAETIDEETHSNCDLTSTTNVTELVQSDYPPEADDRQLVLNSDDPSNNFITDNTFEASSKETERENNDVTDRIERDIFSNFNIQSPSNIVLSNQDYDSSTAPDGEVESNVDTTTITNTEMDSQSNTSLITTEVKIFSKPNLESSNSTIQSNTIQEDSNLNKLPPNNNVTSESQNDAENDTVEKTNDTLKGVSIDQKANLSMDSDDTISENWLPENADSKLTSQCTKALSVNDEQIKYFNRDTRYLSYGSKEMYSPWIQKLIMFCEGNINNDIEERNNCALSEAESEPMVVLDDNNATINYKDNTENSTSQVMENSFSEVKDLGGTSIIEEHSLNNTVYENVCEDIEGENDCNETDKHYKTDSVQSPKDSNISEAFNNSDEIYVSSPGSTNITNAIDNIGNDYVKCNPYSNVEQDLCLLSEDHQQLEKKSSLNMEITKEDNESNLNDKELEESNKQPISHEEITDQLVKQLECNSNDDISDHRNILSKCNDDLPEQWDKQSTSNDKLYDSNEETIEECVKQPNCSDSIVRQSDVNDELLDQENKQYIYDDGVLNQCNKQLDLLELNEPPEARHTKSKHVDEIHVENEISHDTDLEVLQHLDRQPNTNEIEVEPTITVQKNEFSCIKSRQTLKRSLSDSAINVYNSNNGPSQPETEERVHFIWPFKRRKMGNVDNDVLAQNLCNIIQSNRRNSISSVYNEENLSFCILIDNSCIISEEENDEQEKICYTELPEECLNEIQNDCTNDIQDAESIPQVLSTPEEEGSHCEYSDTYVLQGENEKLEEPWVEDVACVETVISDDIAEDIEISGPSSPKDDVFSDNDESEVFSSSEHTDKVKYIYGDKMCNDDAQFVETLYNTPQMNVNKTLIQRETLISGEYYDNDSLEKILSESNEKGQSSYITEYREPLFSPMMINVKQTVDNKENVGLKVMSPLENIANALHVDTDIVNLNKIDDENENFEHFNVTRDDSVHSCESSIDNVFTYKENDEIAKYMTSSSPEVSSTTSEEKSSAILLKITNYKGSRISQINESCRENKNPSCKFTEDKDYVPSHSNFPSHRPLLTKAAQKYIPPLKESIRDLKVKLSLPQHSLMKLKQLKKSKDEPKVCKQSISVPKISMKPKPKFEDVLKSIDEIQFKRHKEKTKKSKKSIPKVVIKKSENGSHYASTSNKNEFNPDLTGRKWQPWVFIEKNHFIDKMAVKKKTKAVYSHRKRTYVLAEKFQKYKSVNSAKFVISPPLSDCPSTGLKYTIRLKHNY